MRLKRILIHVTALVLLVTGALAQTSSGGQHFAKDGLSFDYPAGWTMQDKSTTDIQYLMLTRDGYAEIIVRALRAIIDSPQKEAEAKRIVQDGFVDAWAKNFTDEGARAERSATTIDIAGGSGDCTRLTASLEREPGHVDVCWRLLEKRLVQLTILGSDNDISKTASAWDLIRNNIKIEPQAESQPSPKPSPKP
jgi:hypothetical protein